MADWDIRDGSEADVRAVLELWRLAGSVPTPTDDGESLLVLLRHDPGALVVAEADGTAVGSLVVAWDGWRGSFYRLAVVPDHRRHGLATELVRRGEERLGRRGAVRLNAIVARDEPAAFALWEALGYTWEPGHLRFIRDLGGAAGP